jgi:uncharacterized membrane protein YqjE
MIDDRAPSAGGTLGEYASAGRGERAMSEVVKDIIGKVQGMVRSELRLARAELREEVNRAAAAAKLIGIGAGLALLGGAFLLVSVTLLLALVMPAWVATLITGAALTFAGMVMLSKGRAEFRVPRPDKTIENVKEMSNG